MYRRIFLCYLMFVCVPAQAIDRIKPFSNSQYAIAGEMEFHYRVWAMDGGNAIGHVLLIHGFGGSTFSWEEVADSLHSLDYEVIAVDIPPFGYSDKDHRINQSRTAHAKRIHQLLQQELPGRKWHLAGHSMGGAIAQAYALMYPEDLLSVTFVAPVLFSNLRPDDGDVRFLLRSSPLSWLAGELAEEWLINAGRVEGLLASAYGTEPSETQVAAYLEPLLIPGTARAILSSPVYYQEVDRLDAADLAVPAKAIWGDADDWVSWESQKNTLDRMPEIDLVQLEGVGHNPMETHFEEFMRAWLPFLEAF